VTVNSVLGVNIGGVDGVVDSAPPSLSTSCKVDTSWFMVIAMMVTIIMAPIIVVFFVMASVTLVSNTFSFFNIYITIGHMD
jgi:hypothetical protein